MLRKKHNSKKKKCFGSLSPLYLQHYMCRPAVRMAHQPTRLHTLLDNCSLPNHYPIIITTAIINNT